MALYLIVKYKKVTKQMSLMIENLNHDVKKYY